MSHSDRPPAYIRGWNWLKTRHYRGLAWIKNHHYRQTLVYAALTLVVVFAIGLDQVNRASDKKDICVSGVDTRNVQRATVEAVYELATSLLRRTKDAPPLTPEQVAATNRFIKKANEFRSEMYSQIKPSEACAEHVDDDNVKPPSPGIPLLPKPPEHTEE